MFGDSATKRNPDKCFILVLASISVTGSLISKSQYIILEILSRKVHCLVQVMCYSLTMSHAMIKIALPLNCTRMLCNSTNIQQIILDESLISLHFSKLKWSCKGSKQVTQLVKLQSLSRKHTPESRSSSSWTQLFWWQKSTCSFDLRHPSPNIHCLYTSLFTFEWDKVLNS